MAADHFLLLTPCAQRAKLDFVIHTLPCIRFTAAINDSCFNFKLREGLSAETSGGLLAMCAVRAPARVSCAT